MKSWVKLSSRCFLGAAFSICLMMQVFCAGNAESYSLPKWYLNPPKNDQHKLYGVGQGVTVDDATKEALNQIASKLSVTVSSNWEKSERQATASGSSVYTSEINSNLKSQVAEIKFNNYEIVDNEILDRKTFVLVSVDKDTLLTDKKNEFLNAHFEIENIYATAQNKSIVGKVADLKSLKSKMLHASQLLNMIESLDPTYKTREYFDKYNLYLAGARSALSELRICLLSDPESDDLVPIIKEYLNNANITIVTDDREEDKNTVTVTLKTEVKKLQVYGSKMLKLYTKIEVTAFAHDLVASSKIESKGSSMIGFSEAGKAAALDLEAKIKAKGILNVLGINKDVE
jgi:hypothetical protein